MRARSHAASARRRLLAAAALGVLGAALPRAVAGQAAEPGVLEARGLTAAEIARLASQLGAAQGRADAYHALIELHEESLPGIGARLQALRRNRPDPEAAKNAFTAFRHALGSRRGDDVIDLAQGVLPALAERRDGMLLAMAEPLLLLRALEHMATREAGQRMADVLTLDPPGVWDFELHLARDRVGLRLLPALIALRSHGDARVRAWAQAGVHALGMEDPSLATSQADAHLAAEVIAAYSDPLDFEAMPVLVRLVAADKLELREAARSAVARFGKNAVWQTRQLYAEVAGKSADKRWDAERTARELYAVIDRSAREQAGALLASGMAQFVGGRLSAMQKSYDALLARYPRFEERAKMAPGYAALGDALLEDDKLVPARDAYQRALRLAPEAQDAEQIRAKLAFAEAELALSDGVVDLHGYEQALQHDPKLAAAAEIKDRLSGAKAARERRMKRLAAGAAIGLLVGFMLMMLRGRRGGVERGAAEA